MMKGSVSVTPVILTYNEENNLDTTLASLDWAERVVVLDSGSTDRTQSIARSFSNVAWFVRSFDDHCSQWQYAIHETSVTTEYVLALDADMRPSCGFLDELRERFVGRTFAGACVPFEFRIVGRALYGSIYPAQVRIFRRNSVHVRQVGHTQVFAVNGPLYRFRSKLIHEDRKPVSRWLENQMTYASLEAARIMESRTRSLKDRLRLAGISPAIWATYAYIKAGGPWKSPASRAYAYERLMFEALLSRLLANEPPRCDYCPRQGGEILGGDAGKLPIGRRSNVG
jgi:glycosyltransferase involved in cell wall biosynthesis